MTIIPDDLETAIVMTIPFLITYAALHFILLRPLYEYLQQRHAAVGEALAEAATLESQADGRVATLENKLNAARGEAAALRANARHEAQAQEAAILSKARSEADVAVSEAVAGIKAEQVDAGNALRATADSLSRDIADQVLGREVGA